MTGDEARSHRRALKLSARALGERVGATESSIYRWESRGPRPVPKMYELALLYIVATEAQKRRGKAAC